MIWPARIVGALTASYGLAVAIAPRVLAGPCDLTESDGSISASTKSLCRAIGVRDIASGAAMMTAAQGAPLKAATAIRVSADIGDAVGLGLSLPSAEARKKAAVVAGSWAVVTAVAGALARRPSKD